MRAFLTVMTFMLLCQNSFAQDFWLAYGSQNLYVGNSSLLNPKNDRVFLIKLPLSLSVQYRFKSDFFIETSLAHRIEEIYNESIEVSPLSSFINERDLQRNEAFHAIETTIKIGYIKSFGSLSWITEGGVCLSNFVLFNGPLIPPVSSFDRPSPNLITISEPSNRVDLDLGLGFSYGISQSIDVVVKSINRFRVFRSSYNDKKGRLIYSMPSYRQRLLYGVNVSIRYKVR